MSVRQKPEMGAYLSIHLSLFLSFFENPQASMAMHVQLPIRHRIKITIAMNKVEIHAL